MKKDTFIRTLILHEVREYSKERGRMGSDLERPKIWEFAFLSADMTIDTLSGM